MNKAVRTILIFFLFSSIAWAQNHYIESDGTTSVNGRDVKAKQFTFDVKRIESNQPSMNDKLILVIDEAGFVKIKTQMFQSEHLFGSGEVNQFVRLLKTTQKAAKDARFTKQAGDFRLGDIAGKIILTMSTSAGGNLRYFSLITKSTFPQPRVVEHQISQDIINDLIFLLTKKDKTIGSLSGESKEIKVIKISMSEKGELGAKGGLSLKINKQGGLSTWTVDEVGFTLQLTKSGMATAKAELKKALQYLTTANKTYKDMPNKNFTIKGLGAKPAIATVEGWDGNADRYQFSIKIMGDGEDTERWVVIPQDQLEKLVQSL